MRIYVGALFHCLRCGLKLYTWWEAARAENEGCPKCKDRCYRRLLHP